MTARVFDTKFIANANGDLRGRKNGNVLDRRLRLLEAALSRDLPTRVNGKLLQEYASKVISQGLRNEIVRSFFEFIQDHGVNSGRSTLSRPDHAKARDCRWPSHDQHLLAAILGAKKGSIYATEDAHSRCASAVLREFGVHVVVVT